MDLRAKLIEAGARARCQFGEGVCLPHEHEAAEMLDAFLDCLAENAEEWEYEAFGDSLRELSLARKLTLKALLAVLRDSDV